MVFFTCSNFTQTEKKLVDNSFSSENSEINQLNFAIDFKVNFKQCTFRELKSNTGLFFSPSLKRTPEIHIPEGTIAETYPYYKSKDLYIVLYNKTWGFISKTAFEDMPDNTAVKEINFNPPKLLTKNLSKYLKHIFPETTKGELLLDIHISNTGAIEDIIILKSIPEIDESKIDTLKRLRFKPAKRNGRPVKANFKLPIKYSAED